MASKKRRPRANYLYAPNDNPTRVGTSHHKHSTAWDPRVRHKTCDTCGSTHPSETQRTRSTPTSRHVDSSTRTTETSSSINPKVGKRAPKLHGAFEFRKLIDTLQVREMVPRNVAVGPLFRDFNGARPCRAPREQSPLLPWLSNCCGGCRHNLIHRQYYKFHASPAALLTRQTSRFEK